MKVELINVWKEVIEYIKAVEGGQDKVQAWEKIVVNPYWEKLCCYAPFDLSERKPKAIMNIDKLKAQVAILQKIDASAYRL